MALRKIYRNQLSFCFVLFLNVKTKNTSKEEDQIFHKQYLTMSI